MILGNVNKMHSIYGAKKGNQARIIKFTTYLHTLSATLVKQKIDNKKKKKIENTSARCGQISSHLYHKIELMCSEKPMR